MDKKKNNVQALHLALQILDTVSNSEKSLKFNEILHQLNMTKSNLSKYLSNLAELNFLHRHEDGTYMMGYKMIEYGMSAINHDNIVNRVEPYARLITKELEETTCISIWTSEGPLVVKMFTSNRQINITGPVGTLLPFISASGKLFAAFGHEDQVDVWRKNAFKSLPETAYESLQKEIRDIQEHKIAFAKEPLASSISTVAIPIHDYKNELICAITVIGLSDSIPTQLDLEITQYLLRKRKEISAQFGGV